MAQHLEAQMMLCSTFKVSGRAFCTSPLTPFTPFLSISSMKRDRYSGERSLRFTKHSKSLKEEAEEETGEGKMSQVYLHVYIHSLSLSVTVANRHTY